MEITDVQHVATDRLLTPDEVGERLGVANQTLTNWRHKGIGPDWTKVSGQVGKPGGAVRYPESRLAAYLAERTRPAVAA